MNHNTYMAINISHQTSTLTAKRVNVHVNRVYHNHQEVKITLKNTIFCPQGNEIGSNMAQKVHKHN